MHELKAVLEKMNAEIINFKDKYNLRLDAIEDHLARNMFPAGTSSNSQKVSSAAAREYSDKFYAWARKGSDPDGLRNIEVQAGLSTVSDPDGGYSVPEELSRDIDVLAVDTVAMRQLARITTASGDYKRLLSTGGATGGWVGELDTRTETAPPQLKQFNPPWSEWYALPAVSQVLLDDSAFDVGAWLLDELLDVETTMEGTAFITGNGVKQPKGILSYDTIANASWAWGKIGYIAGGHASLLNNTDKLISLQHALKPAYRKRARWLMNDNTLEVVRQFKNGNGDYIWRQGLAENTPDLLLGNPVEIDDNMPNIGSGAYPIAFADWQRSYLIGDHKAGRRILRDPYTSKGNVLFYCTKRIFGGVINHQAIKLLKISET